MEYSQISRAGPAPDLSADSRPNSVWRRSLPAIAAVLACALFAIEAYGIVTFHSIVPSFETPRRLDWCGRTYLLSRSGEQRMSIPAGAREVLLGPLGQPIYAVELTPAEQSAHSTTVCAMALYLEGWDGTIRAYGLSGGH